MYRRILVGCVLLLVCAGSPLDTPGGTPVFAARQDVSGPGAGTDTASALRAIVREPGGLTSEPLASEEIRDLDRLYGAGCAPLWTDAAGRPTHDAADALALLTGAAGEGLDPLDYRAEVLARTSDALARAAQPVVGEVAAFDAGMSANTLRYLRHLHLGRVNPRTIGFRMPDPRDEHDFVGALRDALTRHRVAETAAGFEPPLVLYRALRDMLARYRAIEAGGASPPEFPRNTTIRPDDLYDGAAALRRWLVTLGDLPAATPAGSNTAASYNASLVAGVRRFQARHALTPDGILGRQTQAALRVPLSHRVRQIELALERLRWLPDLDSGRFLAVNIPMFRLWVWDAVQPAEAPALGMNVIVGRALRTQTPVFVEEMRYLIFRPYWNVPRSILRSELLPAVRRDPKYFERHAYEIVAGQTDDARPVPLTAQALDQLAAGALRVRQRPGPNNSLGLVKFVFPNDENVYLHSTPAKALFSRSRRDFSHGCVRVEEPVALAAWALRDDPEWTPERIVAAMNGSGTLRVDLARPIQVVFFYVTAVVMPEDGSIHFVDDIYGHDARLDAALRRGAAVR